MGKFIKENCPSYLKPDNFKMLKDGAVSKLEVVTGTFMEALMSRKYTKVILMDHVDWLDDAAAQELARALKAQVRGCQFVDCKYALAATPPESTT
jgi:betaine lipid synthase